jgi:hypothetical protein
MSLVNHHAIPQIVDNLSLLKDKISNIKVIEYYSTSLTIKMALTREFTHEELISLGVLIGNIEKQAVS